MPAEALLAGQPAVPMALQVVSVATSALFLLFEANEDARCVAVFDLGCQLSACADQVAFSHLGTSAPIVPRWRQRWSERLLRGDVLLVGVCLRLMQALPCLAVGYSYACLQGKCIILSLKDTENAFYKQK